MLTEEEKQKGYLSFNNTEVVDPTGQANGQGGSIVRRYSQPPAPTATVAPTPAAPASGQNLAFGGLLGFDQFSQQRTGNVDEAAIREETRKAMQARIDATNNYYADLVGREKQAGEGRLDKVRAINVNSGLSGSNFATSADLEQRGLNDKAVKGIEAERNLKVQEVYGKIDEIARAEIAARKLEATGNADKYSEYLAKAKEEATGQLAQLASANIDLSQLDPNRRSYLFKAAGLDDQLGELVYNSLKPKAAKIEYKAEKAADGKILLYGVDPVTGQLKTQRLNFDVPEGYEPTYVDGQLYYKNAATGDLIPAPMDQSLYTPDYKNYLLSKKEGYTGDFNSWQTEDANRKRPVSTTVNYGGDYNSKQLSALTRLNNDVDKSATYAKAKTMSTFGNNVLIALDQASGVSDIAAINQFQKVIDEGAVTRDVDVRLIQQAQSLFGSLKTRIKKLETGEQLSPDQRQQMRDLVNAMVQAGKTAVLNDPFIKAKTKEAEQNGLNLNDTILGELGIGSHGADDGLSDDDAYELYLKASGGGQ